MKWNFKCYCGFPEEFKCYCAGSQENLSATVVFHMQTSKKVLNSHPATPYRRTPRKAFLLFCPLGHSASFAAYPAAVMLEASRWGVDKRLDLWSALMFVNGSVAHARRAAGSDVWPEGPGLWTFSGDAAYRAPSTQQAATKI